MNRAEYEKQFAEFCEQSKADGRFTPLASEQNAILSDDGDQTIHISWDYLMHTSWAARKLAQYKPASHVDFGSYVYFAGLCSAFVPNFTFADVRPIHFPQGGLRCVSADLTRLPFTDNSLESISCLHVMEHIGLGRYGDTLDASGDLKAADELCRVLAPGGHLLMVLPMNERPRVHFNAHRFYSWKQVREMFWKLSMQESNFIHEGRIDGGEVFPTGDYTACLMFKKYSAVSA